MQEAFIDCLIHHFRRVITNPLTDLNKGIWYASDYHPVAQKLGDKDLLERFVEEDHFFHGNVPQEAMMSVADPNSPTGRRLYSFLIRKEATPSQAVASIEKGPSILECGSVFYLSIYLTLKEILGAKKFDFLFAADSTTPFYLTSDPINSAAKLFKQVFITNESSIKKGDLCYFSNIKDYVVKHFAGDARGANALCYKENPKRYMAFGFSPHGVRRKDIEIEMWRAYNIAPIDEGFYSPQLLKYLYSRYLSRDEEKSRALVDSYRDKKITWQEFQSLPPRIASKGIPTEGKLRLWVYRLDVARLDKLVEAPIEKVREVLT